MIYRENVNYSGPERFYFSSYPLQKSLFILGSIFAIVFFILLNSYVLSLSIFGLFFIVGMLWRRDEPPVLAFAIAYQWLFVISGYMFELIVGRFPNYTLVGNLEKAIFLSMIGFLLIALGIRVVFYLFKNSLSKKLYSLRKSTKKINIKNLFYFVVAIHLINWFVVISPMQILFNAAQILYNILAVQDVLLLTLFFVVITQNEGYKYAFAAFFISIIPRFVSTQSTFKSIFFLLIIAVLTEFKPWTKNPLKKVKNNKIVVFTSIVLLVLLCLAIVWESAVKPSWRRADVVGSPLERLEQFYEITKSPISELNISIGFESLVDRVSSVEQFSLVLDRVPYIFPHENGKLLVRTFEHILKPRFLFPDKPILERDSWMTEKYAGIKVHRNTSVGIGYMAEFYVDFGVPLMFAMTFFYGLIIGLIYVLLCSQSTSYYFFLSCITIPFLNNFLEYEGNFTKLIGGILVSTFIIILFLFLISPWINSKINYKRVSSSNFKY